MFSIRKYALCVLTSLAFLAPVNSQEPPPEPEPTMNVPGTLHTGQEATINYSNPALANQEVVIDIDDGDPGGQTDQVVIQLDENGEGSGTWTPPGWDMAVFNGPDVDAVTKGVHP